MRPCIVLLAACLLALAAALGAAEPRRPNVVLIFVDDLGYGDLGCQGHPTIRTPHIDRLAREGVRFTSFYSACAICSPARAALLTGRYPLRTGVYGGVFFPNSPGGLPAREVTIAELLADAGYATMAIGKWHLGHLEEHLPTAHGFADWLGVPYSNDMLWNKRGDPPFPLMRGNRIVEQPIDQRSLTGRYTEAAEEFIAEHAEQPFFLYLAHTFPHVPLYPGEAWHGRSRRGTYGDVVEEIDASTGRVLAALAAAGVAADPLVLWTSDNGPWLSKRQHGGTAGLLRGGKMTTWEGGMRVPAVLRWPSHTEGGGRSDEICSTLDVLPTVCAAAGVEPPPVALDGRDLAPMLSGIREEDAVRRDFFYYRGAQIWAVRSGPWKLHVKVRPERRGADTPAVPLLYDLDVDPGERWNLAGRHPEVVERLQALIAEQTATVAAAESEVGRPRLDRETTRHSLDYALVE